MKLKERTTLWGNSTIHLKDYSKRYKLLSTLFMLIDLVLVAFFVYNMYVKGTTFGTYMVVMLILCLVPLSLSAVFLNESKWRTYKFYNRYKNCSVTIKKYKVTEKSLYSILYCTNYKRVKIDKSLEYYKELFISACCEDTIYSKKIMRFLSKYEDEEGNLSVYTLSSGNKQFFIDFVDESKTN